MDFSKFSQKFSTNAGILQLMDDLGNTLESGRNLYMLGGGNPAHIPEMEQHFREEMQALLKDGKRFEAAVGDYDPPLGNIRFRLSLTKWLNSKYDWNIDVENIAITNGSQATFGILFNLFAGEFADGSQKRILFPLTPEYIGYGDVGLGDDDLFNACMPSIEVIGDNQFKYHIDFEKLSIIGDEIGAVCVSRPTNPTGNVLTDTEINKLRSLTKNAGIPLIIDGAYGLPFPDILFTPASLVWDKDIVLCLSLSKLGLPGVRTGIVIADKPLIELLSSSNAIFNLAPGSFGPSLVNRLVASGSLTELCQQHIRPFYKERSQWAIERVIDLMSDIPVRIHVSEGAIFLWLWFENLPVSSEQLYQRLKQRGVLVIAGHHFFPGLNEEWTHKYECIRITYASDQKQVDHGLAIIAEEVKQIYNS